VKTRIVASIILASLLPAISTQGQVLDSGDLTEKIDSIIADMPSTRDGGDYVQPDQSSQAIWRDIVEHILSGDYSAAHAEALTIGYQVELFTDTGSDDPSDHILLRRLSDVSAPHWGTFVFSTSPLRSHL